MILCRPMVSYAQRKLILKQISCWVLSVKEIFLNQLRFDKVTAKVWGLTFWDTMYVIPLHAAKWDVLVNVLCRVAGEFAADRERIASSETRPDADSWTVHVLLSGSADCSTVTQSWDVSSEIAAISRYVAGQCATTRLNTDCWAVHFLLSGNADCSSVTRCWSLSPQ